MSAGVAPSSSPWLVAFDTSSPVGSVVLARGSSVVARELLERRADHAARLVPAIAGVLAEGGVARSDLSGVVVGEGPGSFTGIRIAAATAKGLTHALGIPLWTISSLAAAALAAEAGPIRYVLFDARQERVYAACYGVESGGVQTLVSPRADGLRDLLGRQVPAGAVFVGDGAERHRALIEGAGFPVADPRGGVPLAEGLIRYRASVPKQAPVPNTARWEPHYVRQWSGKSSWTS